MAALTPKRNGQAHQPYPDRTAVRPQLYEDIADQGVARVTSTGCRSDAEPVSEPSNTSVAADLRLRRDIGGKGGDWLIWQLIDSAFPTGGFAHSGGLEAAWQHGEVRTRAELASFLEAALEQASHSLIPFVTAVHDGREALSDVDRLFDAFTSNHVANRASRSQGRALLSAAERIFGVGGGTDAPTPIPAPFSHLAPAFGYVTGCLGIPRGAAVEMFVFNYLRALLAAAVRLNIAGPMEAQILQFRLAETAKRACKKGAALCLDDIAQTAPLLDVWQGAQDRLYSRLFQS